MNAPHIDTERKIKMTDSRDKEARMIESGGCSPVVDHAVVRTRRIRFAGRLCRSCDGEKCEHCDNSDCKEPGYFRAKLKDDWQFPEIPEGWYMLAILDYNEWHFVGIQSSLSGDHEEIEWPFATDWADAEDLKHLGFNVRTS